MKMGWVTLVGMLLTGCGRGLDVEPPRLVLPKSDPSLYVLSEAERSVSVFKIAPSTGYPMFLHQFTLPDPVVANASLAADPDGRYLLVVNGSSMTLSVLGLQNGDGMIWGQTGTVPLPYSPNRYGIAIGPSGDGTKQRRAYVSMNDASHPYVIATYDQKTGQFSGINGSPPGVGGTPVPAPLGLHPSGRQLYVPTTPNLARVPLNGDGAVGSGVTIASYASGYNALAVSGDGGWLYASRNTTTGIDLVALAPDGAPISVSSINTGGVRWIATSPFGSTVYVLTNTSIDVYSADMSVLKQNLTIADSNPRMIVADGMTQSLYLIGCGSSPPLLYRYSIAGDQTLVTAETVSLSWLSCPDSIAIAYVPQLIF